jgi:hypothetical protein
VIGEVPTFSSGEEKTARVTVHNPTAKAFDYVGQLWITKQRAGLHYVETWAETSFRLEPDEQKGILFPVVMPLKEGTYPVSICILVGEEVIATKAVEDIEIIAPVPKLTIDRFFVVTRPAADHGDFEAHCHIKNTGGSTATGKLNLVGEVAVAWQTKEINETKEFTLGPGEVYKYVYRDSTYKGDQGQLKVVGEWGEATPTLEFEAGYFEYGVNIVATEIGADYVYLRYTRDEDCDTWGFGLETKPPEQTINFPALKISGGWPTIYHLVTGLLPGRTYKAWCLGSNGGWKTAQTEFTT